MVLRSPPLAFVSLPSSAGGLKLFHSTGSLSKTIYVEHSGVQPYLDVNKTSISLQNDGFGGDFEKCVEVTTKDTGDYIVTVDSSCDWIRVSDKSIDDFNDSLSTITLSSGDDFWISVSDNMGGNARTGSISIKHETGSIIKMVTVIQSGRDINTLEASTEYVQFNSSDSDTELLEVYAGNDLEWTALSTDGWINVMDCYASSKKNLISETGSAKFYISVKENKSSKTREGYFICQCTDSIFPV